MKHRVNNARTDGFTLGGSAKKQWGSSGKDKQTENNSQLKMRGNTFENVSIFPEKRENWEAAMNQWTVWV